jgi:uncharacterized protein
MCDFSEHSYDYFLKISKGSAENYAAAQYPSLKSAACGADTFNASVVDAEGKICKCWCDVGVPDRQVGSIIEAVPPTNSLYFDYMMLDPTSTEPCKDCNLLPICMGGCPIKRLAEGKDSCTNQKYILERTTRSAVEGMKAERIKSHA